MMLWEISFPDNKFEEVNTLQDLYDHALFYYCSTAVALCGSRNHQEDPMNPVNLPFFGSLALLL
jgi:hypothetical protein